MTAKPCLDCGELSPESRCSDCTAPREDLSSRERGYDSAWDRLSRRARALQPWCQDCGSTDDLTADHTPEGWRRKARGLALRLVDVEVVCQSCNKKRGSSRPGSARAGGGSVRSDGRKDAGGRRRGDHIPPVTRLDTPEIVAERPLSRPRSLIRGEDQ